MTYELPEVSIGYDTELATLADVHRLGYCVPLDGDRSRGVLTPQTLAGEDMLYKFITTCPAECIQSGVIEKEQGQ